MTSNLTNYYLKDDPSWAILPEPEVFVDYINPVGGYYIDLKLADIRHKKLPFYENLEIIRIYGDKWNEIPEEEFCAFFLRQGPDLIELDGISESIYRANDLGKLILNRDTCADYLKFFCMFLTPEDSNQPFYILEGPESEFIYNFSKFDKDKFLKDYKGMTVTESVSSGLFNAHARVMQADSLYDAYFEIYPDGTVVMKDDVLVGAA